MLVIDGWENTIRLTHEDLDKVLSVEDRVEQDNMLIEYEGDAADFVGEAS